jgi:hypothetical protein
MRLQRARQGQLGLGEGAGPLLGERDGVFEPFRGFAVLAAVQIVEVPALAGEHRVLQNAGEDRECVRSGVRQRVLCLLRGVRDCFGVTGLVDFGDGRGPERQKDRIREVTLETILLDDGDAGAEEADLDAARPKTEGGISGVLSALVSCCPR